jgi:hypothetical protein
VASAWRVAPGGDLTDVVAITQVLLDRSEAFRFAVSPPAGRAWPPTSPPKWSERITSTAAEWIGWLERGHGPPPALVDGMWRIILDDVDLPLEDVASGTAWPFCEALLTLHAVADECCAGLLGEADARHRPGRVYRAWGRELLARSGSLSRMAPDHVRVFPKMGTSTGGMSLRSLSRYACVSPAGVGATWHKTPLRMSEHQTRMQHNLLLLPWPLRVRGSDFRPLADSVQRTAVEPFGFFQFAPPERIDLDLVDRLIVAALDEVDAVDMVVLPESAVEQHELGELEALLGCRGVGVLIAGVRAAPDQDGCFPGNWVHLGVSLEGRWWHYRQNKHHRWSLDASQLDQYHLGASLHPGVLWWEAMDVPRRSVQFLELGDGITLAFLVCEDLARLDVVADLLRSVSPTLVMTVLLDGPQLASRWTARYASVLADDPGSAVLTLTSYGMVKRSRPAGTEASKIVSLWKDANSGLREIPLDDGADAVLFTACAKRTARHSADGRWPSSDATTLFGAGVHQVRAGDVGAPVVRAGGRPSTPELSLDTTELTILVSWAEAVAGALSSDPDQIERLLVEATTGARWRSRLGVAEPSRRLADAIAALFDLVADGGESGRPAPLTDVIRAVGVDRPEEPAPERLARQILHGVLGSQRAPA